MEFIQRKIASLIRDDFFTGKAICLLGARQTGKTTLIRSIVKDDNNVLWLNADELQVRQMLENANLSQLRSLLGNKRIIVVDEAQRIEDVGIKMKLIIDNFPDKQLLITGSSSLELANHINEPLTGRIWEYRMHPFSFGELAAHNGTFAEVQHLPIRLVYGSYPDVVNRVGDEQRTLEMLTESYLYKDVLQWDRIKRTDRIVKLLQALAYQVGSEVSYSELGSMLQMDKETISKYIAILEQAFVVFQVGSFSRNLRNELKFAKKVFFYDNGIRNALINNFADIQIRTDAGALWENWMVSELRKKLDYTDQHQPIYFWRTTSQKEIDFLTERNGRITAYEFKWSPNKKSRKQDAFLQAYPNATLQTITPENYFEALLDA